MPKATWKTCPSGSWTNIQESPTWGFSYVDTQVPVRVRWRRYSDGIPWYSEGTADLKVGQNTIVHGGPSAYCRLEVKPDFTVNLFAH